MIKTSFKIEEPVFIHSVPSACEFVKRFYKGFEGQEMFCFVPMSNSNKALSVEVLSIGGLSGTVVDTAVLFRKFLKHKTAKKLMLFHNHPSGNSKPSDADIKVTNNIKAACSLFDVVLVDHIILTDNKPTSFVEQDLL